MLKVQILTDNRTEKRGLLAEHGLSLWIEKDDKVILFDTGQSGVFVHNAKVLGLQLAQVEYIVLSHGHYDHCGGLAYFPQQDKAPKIYLHRDALQKKFAANRSVGSYREVGIPPQTVTQAWLKEALVLNKEPLEIAAGILVSGGIPCSQDGAEQPQGFYLEGANGQFLRDLMLDEQMLIIEDAGELAVFLGCGHPGVSNCLNYVRKLVPGKKIKLLIAGMHLEKVSSLRLEESIRQISELNITKVVPVHCTGLRAMTAIQASLGEHCQLLCAGDQLEI